MSFSLLFTRFYASLPKHLVVNLPALSPTMTSGSIAVWRKAAGDKVEPGDVLVEIETDKAQMEFEAPEEGYLAKVLIPDGTKDVAVSTVLASFLYFDSSLWQLLLIRRKILKLSRITRPMMKQVRKNLNQKRSLHLQLPQVLLVAQSMQCQTVGLP